jgi:LytS/YehU family sensor histidine kinase
MKSSADAKSSVECLVSSVLDGWMDGFYALLLGRCSRWRALLVTCSITGSGCHAGMLLQYARLHEQNNAAAIPV